MRMWRTIIAMYQNYVFILIIAAWRILIGCKVTATSAIRVYPSSIICYRDCDKNISCISSSDLFGKMEWIYPNFTVISQMDAAAKIHVQHNSLIFNNPDVSDAGKYTCRLPENHSENITATLIITFFMYGSSNRLYDIKSALRYHNTFINCSILPADAFKIWKYRNATISNSDKYTKNDSGLMIHNVTDNDEGQYVCTTLTLLQAFINLSVHWAPELLPQQNQIIIANINEEVILNCTRSISASPTPLYRWLFTDSCASCTNIDGVFMFTVEDITNSGEYTCVAENQYGNLSVTFNVTVIIPPRPTVKFGNDSVLIEERYALLGSDVFINCSVNHETEYNITSWLFNNEPFNLTSRFYQNKSSLIIYNVTKLDEGNYTCNADRFIWAVIFLHIEWPPELTSEQSQTVTVSVGEEVILNCTVSASPDPIYSWLFPDSCSSCPNTNNDSALIFTAKDDANNGEYICIAKNEYNIVSRSFILHIIMNTDCDQDTMIMKSKNNIILTCCYSIATSNITWDIVTPLSGIYVEQENHNNNDSSDYTLYSNGSIGIYYQFLFEKSYIVVKCSSDYFHKQKNKTFYLWEHGIYTKTQDFKVYIKNLTNCQDLEKLQKINKTVKELIQSLRTWFSSVCKCDGHSNLLYPNLTCVNDQTGIITSTVHRDGLLSAKELIDLARSDIKARDPPAVHLSHGWILCLNISSEAQTGFASSSMSLGLSMMIAAGVASLCTVISLLLCITIGIIYMKYRRMDKNIKDSDDDEDMPHKYDEIDNYSIAADDKKSRSLEDEIVFDATARSAPPEQEESLYDIAGTDHDVMSPTHQLATVTSADYVVMSPAHQLATVTSANNDERKLLCNYEIMGSKKQCIKQNF